MTRERIENAPAFRVEGRPVESETVSCYAGAHVLELATAIPELGVHVETVYVTSTGDETQVTDLMTAGDEEILATRRLTPHPICGDVARTRCLRDHVEQVVAFLVSLGHGDPRCETRVGEHSSSRS
jgi:hypothetical protein